MHYIFIITNWYIFQNKSISLFENQYEIENITLTPCRFIWYGHDSIIIDENQLIPISPYINTFLMHILS